MSGELVVGGVFLRLFIANPAWTVRQPRQFVIELVERTLTEMRSDGSETLETLTTALVALLRYHSNTADQVFDYC
jgi:DnaJ family protein C protein 13